MVGLTGERGGYIIYERRGQLCVRRKPERKGEVLQAGMVAQQERVAAVAVLFRQIKEAGLYSLWQEAARGQLAHGYNLVQRANVGAFDGVGRVRAFEKLCLTPGLMPLPDGLTLEWEMTREMAGTMMKVSIPYKEGEATGGTWRLTWGLKEPLPGTSVTDRLVALAMRDEDTFTLFPVDTGDASRGDGEATLALTGEAARCEHVYVFFRSRSVLLSTHSFYFNLKKIKCL